jgi:membrane fusion protein, multidrug efflux system
LKSVAVDIGDAVKAGQTLAVIEQPEMQSDIDRLTSDAKVAELEFKRVSEAQKKAADLVVPQTVDNARAKFESAAASLRRAQTLVDYAKIIAPFDGVVTKRWLDPGALLPATAGTPEASAIVTVTDASKVRVVIPVPQSEVALIQNGLPVSVAIKELPGVEKKGTITRSSGALDPETRTMAVEVELENADARIKPGMFARAKIGIETHADATLVPVAALLTEKTAASVFLPQDGTAKKVKVAIGFNDGANAEIKEGAVPGQQVIVVGKAALNDGQAITIVPASNPSKP